MSVRVNLLPGDVSKRAAASRARFAVGAVLLGLVVVMGLLYMNQLSRVSAAQDDVDVAQAQVQALQARLTDLAEFSDLQARATTSDAVLAAALGSEASVAGVMQDVAAVMPGDAALETMSITIAPVPVAPQLGDARASFGTISFSGKSLRGHAPGVERLLIEFEKIAAFHDLFFSSSEVDLEVGTTTFAVEIDLGPEILSGRYALGLPEALR